MSFRQVQDLVNKGSETISYQLYMQFEPVSASREVFLPQHLNYYGLLGYNEEIDSVSLFYDDLALEND
jgi:hypothetical protein